MSDTREITYVGTHRRVWLPGDAACVARGESVTVPSALADELLARRDKGVKQWKPKTAAKKAAATKADEADIDTPTSEEN